MWIEWMQKLDRGLEKVERALAVVLFVLLIGMICTNILSRNILRISFESLLELSPTVVLWLALVGATLALKHQRHIKIELLLRFFPHPLQMLAGILTSLFAMGVSAALALAGMTFVHNEIVLFGARGWSAACLVLFFALAFFRFSLRLLQPWCRSQGERS